MKTKNIFIALGLGVLLTFTSCSSDNETQTVPEQFTTIQNISGDLKELHINNGVLNSINKTFKYNTEFTYNGNLITSVVEKEASASGFTCSTKNILYNGTKISKITTTITFVGYYVNGIPDTFSGIDYLGTIEENFSYLPNNEVSVEVIKTDTNGLTSTPITSIFTVVNNNITKIIQNDPSLPNETTKNFTFDNKFNPFSNLSSLEYLVLIYKDKISFNNVISKVEVEKGLTHTFTYTYNANNFYTNKKGFTNSVPSFEENVYHYK